MNFYEFSLILEEQGDFLKKLSYFLDRLSRTLAYTKYYYEFKYKVLHKQNNFVECFDNLLKILMEIDYYHFKYINNEWNMLDKTNIEKVQNWYSNSLLPAISRQSDLHTTIKHYKDEVGAI